MKTLVFDYGIAWPRNTLSLKKIKKDLGKKTGVYVLTNGPMPMYVGKGQIAKELKGTRDQAPRKLNTGTTFLGLSSIILDSRVS